MDLDDNEFFDKLRGTTKPKLNKNPFKLKAMLFENYLKSEFSEATHEIKPETTSTGECVVLRSNVINLSYMFLYSDEKVLDTPFDELPILFNDRYPNDFIKMADWIRYAKILERLLIHIKEINNGYGCIYGGDLSIMAQLDVRMICVSYRSRTITISFSKYFPIHEKIEMNEQSLIVDVISFYELETNYDGCLNRILFSSQKMFDLYHYARAEYERLESVFKHNITNRIKEMTINVY